MLKSLAHLFCWVIYEFWESFINSGFKDFSRYVICKCFLPVCGLYFHINSDTKRAEVLNFNKVQFINLFSHGLCFWGHIYEAFAWSKVTEIFLLFSSGNFMILSLTLRSMIHFFWSIFVHGVNLWTEILFFLHDDTKLFQHHLFPWHVCLEKDFRVEMIHSTLPGKLLLILQNPGQMSPWPRSLPWLRPSSFHLSSGVQNVVQTLPFFLIPHDCINSQVFLSW